LREVADTGFALADDVETNFDLREIVEAGFDWADDAAFFGFCEVAAAPCDFAADARATALFDVRVAPVRAVLVATFARFAGFDGDATRLAPDLDLSFDPATPAHYTPKPLTRAPRASNVRAA
jgi:hypothetical protein